MSWKVTPGIFIRKGMLEITTHKDGAVSVQKHGLLEAIALSEEQANDLVDALEYVRNYDADSVAQ